MSRAPVMWNALAFSPSTTQMNWGIASLPIVVSAPCTPLVNESSIKCLLSDSTHKRG